MPRLGLGMPIVSGVTSAPVTLIDDFFFESNASGEVNPILTTSRTNLIRNSNFATDSIWSKTNATIDTSANKSTITVTSGGFSALSQGITFEDGKTYTVSAVINGESGKEMRFQDNGNNTGGLTTSNGVITMTGSDQNVEITWTANSNSTEFVIARNTSSGSYSFDISKVQVEQDGFASAFIPTAGSTVTVSTTLNDTSEVWDFDSTDIMLEADPEDEGFWEEGSNLVLNHDYADLGSEEFANGSFTGVADGTDVTTLTNWNTYGSPTSRNVVDNKLVIVATGGNQGAFYDLGSLSAGTYKLSVDVTGDVGVGGIYISGGTSLNVTTSVGNVEFYFVASGSTNIFFRAANNNAGTTSYTNISIKQVDPNDRWTLGTGWSIEDGVLTSDGTATNATQGISIAAGNTYEVTFTISSYTSGAVRITLNNSGDSGSNTSDISSAGTYTTYLTVGTITSGNLIIDPRSNFVGSIDNVTVREYAVQPKDI